MTQNSYVLAGDVGGTNLRIAAVDPGGGVIHLSETPTPREGTASDIVTAIVGGAESCMRIADRGRPMAFCLALPALVDSSAGRVWSSPNLPQLNGKHLAAEIQGKLDLRIALENDATAAAIGEHWLGSTTGAQNSIFVTLGTGIGGGLIFGGRPYRGVDGTAGEIGHICVERDGLECGCGSRGCVEQYASARAIARIATEIASDNASATRFPTSKDVFNAASAGDADALVAFSVMGRYLGLALAALVNVLNPEIIAIGGGASGAWDFFAEPVRAEIMARAFRHPAARVVLVKATLGKSAGILGAARVALDSV